MKTKAMTAAELAAKAGTQISKAEQYMRDPYSVSRPTRKKLDGVLGIRRKHGGARSGKRGRHKVQRTCGSDRFADYETLLSREMNKACTDWLDALEGPSRRCKGSPSNLGAPMTLPRSSGVPDLWHASSAASPAINERDPPI